MTASAKRADALTVFFGPDYAPFYERVQPAERAEREADLLIRLLELEPGARLLDAACSYGRIATRLARRGLCVVGVDLNDVALDRARELANELGVADETRFVLDDLRTFADAEPFAAAISWFTSFGYFSESEDASILANLARNLAPGGRIALEVLSLNAVLGTLDGARSLPVLVSEIDDDNAVVDRIRLADDREGIVVNRVVEHTDGLARATLAVRAFRLEDLAEWLSRAGFTDVTHYEPTEAERDLFTQWSLIVVANRER